MRRFLPILFLLVGIQIISFAQGIPLPEHPRPDFERPNWQNLNGDWAFAFDPNNIGLQESWQLGNHPFDKKITVPFPWGSQLSGLADEADIGWYQRTISVDKAWEGQRIFLTIGASDWKTTIWLDGKRIGEHQGGYVPFSFELTNALRFGESQRLVIRVDDARRDFTLYGKQGYGNARGIWQTIYLEARGKNFLDALHITPDIDAAKVMVTAYLPEPAPNDLSLNLNILGEGAPITRYLQIEKGAHKRTFEIPIPNPHLWTLVDPFLYTVEAQLEDDLLRTYFGMRKISVEHLPGTDYPYIALNNQPIYLQLALDQSYHPEGYYTFPSDQFLQEEIMRSKNIGLNGIRTHIKVEVPRKLYWADKLGLLVMEDLPNSWGEPDRYMQAESEYTLREMIKRDYNHPAIFSWVVFNETWGLFTEVDQGKDGKEQKYLTQTQNWVASMYYLAKSLDGSRLVEDNSICCGRGHTETDINSWHQYLPGYKWDEHIQKIVENTFEGSTHHFEEGFQQGRQPNINSECGNVWGYDGSTGDVDWSYDYHRMMNSFRRFPKIAGWLYTEHHDVINEWNGYWRFDRSEKETGMGEIMKGMRLNDLHSPVYLSMGNDITQTVKGGEVILQPMFLSVMTGQDFGQTLSIESELWHTNYLGETAKQFQSIQLVNYQPWMQDTLPDLRLNIPQSNGLSVLQVKVLDEAGNILHRNFKHFEVIEGAAIPGVQVLSSLPQNYSAANWSQKEWSVLAGKKVNGAGQGYFEYTLAVPASVRLGSAKEAYLIVEASAKQLFVKDQKDYNANQDFMKGSVVAPSSNPNAYPMTDTERFPSKITVLINGRKVSTKILPDDPADHRGVLSWHHQLKDGKLREAGSYGYLIKIPLKRSILRKAAREGKIQFRLQAQGEGGLAIYGKDFGRYPFDPSLIIR